MLDKTEWLEMRRSKIGASDAPVIMNMSPWKTPYSLWKEKVGLPSDQYVNNAMRRGLMLESEALEAYEQMTGNVMFPQVVINHPTISWMMATMDGISTDKKCGVEIKCAGKRDHDIAKKGDIPDKYIPQLQHQIEVCGLDKIDYFSYHGKDGVIVEVKRDDEFISRMLKEEEEFFQRVMEFRPPEKTGKDLPTEFIVREDDMWTSRVQESLLIRRQIKELELRDKQLLEELKLLAEGRDTMGGGASLRKRVRIGAIEYKNIPQLEGVDLDAYRKPPTEYWTLEEDT